MAASPEKKKKKKESTTISMVVENWKDGQTEQFSPVHRINGFPWRLRVYNTSPTLRCLSLICDKSRESELWECTALVDVYRRAFSPIAQSNCFSLNHQFTSWDEAGHEKRLMPATSINLHARTKIEVGISSVEDGAIYGIRPSLNPSEPRDGVLVIGKKKIHVNKKRLAAQSPYFDKLFNGDFKEKNLTEIPIGDVEYKEFANIMAIFHDSDGISLTEDNVCRMLELAERFQLKIVEDVIVNFLFSNESPTFTIYKILLIAEKFNLSFPKEHFLKVCTKEKIAELIDSPEFEQLSFDTLKEVFNKGVNFFSFAEDTPKVTVTDPAPIEPSDGIIVFGEEKKPIHVNKKSLASLSPYFDRLFFGDFMEKDSNEISIGDCEFEEFTLMMAILYGSDCGALNGQNIDRILELADRFDLKIIEARIASILLSSSSSLSTHHKLQLITDCPHFYPLVDDFLAQFHSVEDLKSLSASHEWKQLSKESIRILFEKFCI